MKKVVVLMIVMTFTSMSSMVMADNNGESREGRLFLYQKCDQSLIGAENHDSLGCPTAIGPWPILQGSSRWGKLNYSLWGETFHFSFAGRGLLPSTNYTLIYYPDPWPGYQLICLGSGQTTPATVEEGTSRGKGKGKGKGKGHHRGGNLTINGDVEIGTSLPASYDANFTPAGDSGAMGAKIRLVLTEDVQCTGTDPNTDPATMLNWNPTEYLFEYNLINFEYRAELPEPY